MASNTAPHCVPWHRPPGQVCCSAGVAKKASEQPGYRFRNLFGMLNEEMLKDSWQFIRKDAACGVDRVSAKEYEQNLDENIHQLVEDLKRKRYRAKHAEGSAVHPEREWQVPSVGDASRATQDKLLQVAVKRLLEANFEQDFLPSSFGYRLGFEFRWGKDRKGKPLVQD